MNYARTLTLSSPHIVVCRDRNSNSVVQLEVAADELQAPFLSDGGSRFCFFRSAGSWKPPPALRAGLSAAASCFLLSHLVLKVLLVCVCSRVFVQEISGRAGYKNTRRQARAVKQRPHLHRAAKEVAPVSGRPRMRPVDSSTKDGFGSEETRSATSSSGGGNEDGQSSSNYH